MGQNKFFETNVREGEISFWQDLMKEYDRQGIHSLNPVFFLLMFFSDEFF